MPRFSLHLHQQNREADEHHSEDDEDTREIISCQKEVDYRTSEHHQSYHEEDEGYHFYDTEPVVRRCSVFANLLESVLPLVSIRQRLIPSIRWAPRNGSFKYCEGDENFPLLMQIAVKNILLRNCDISVWYNEKNRISSVQLLTLLFDSRILAPEHEGALCFLSVCTSIPQSSMGRRGDLLRHDGLNKR